MCFLDAKELFVLYGIYIKANLGFLQKSSKDHILVEKRQKSKKGQIKFLNGNYNVDHEKKNKFLSVHLRHPPFQMDPRASKTPVCPVASVETFIS